MDFSIEAINPTAQELQKLSDSYKDLKINGIDDKEGYAIVKQARLDLKEKRVYITKVLKTAREEAIVFQKKVISHEKMLVGIIEETEDKLKEQEDNYNLELKKEERKKILPQRTEELQKIGITDIDEDAILSMNDVEFITYVNNERTRILNEKEAELKAKQDAIDEEKNKEARAAEIKQAQDEAAEKARVETEERMKREQSEKEEKEKADAEAKAQAEKEEQEKLEKRKKYNKWLEDNGYSIDDTSIQLRKEGDRMVLYKKISEFII